MGSSPQDQRSSIFYSRRVSFTEKIYLGLDRYRPGFCINYVIEGNGKIPLSRLVEAVQKASAANPGSQLILKGFLGWMYWEATGPLPRVREVNSWGSELPLSDLRIPLSPNKGPTCEVLFVHGDPLRIVFRCFHGVMDGRGLILFAEDVFRALRGEPLVGTSSMCNDTQLADSIIGNQYRKPTKINCPSIHQPSKSTSRALNLKKISLGKSVNGIIPRLALAVAKVNAKHNRLPVRIFIPVDLRSYNPKIKSTANLTFPLILEIDAEQNCEAVQKTILREIQKKTALKKDPLARIIPWMPIKMVQYLLFFLISFQRFTGRYLYSALITHLQIQDPKILSAPDFQCTKMYFIPADNEMINFGVSSVTVGDNTEVVLFAPQYLIGKQQMDYLAADILNAID